MLCHLAVNITCTCTCTMRMASRCMGMHLLLLALLKGHVGHVVAQVGMLVWDNISRFGLQYAMSNGSGCFEV